VHGDVLVLIALNVVLNEVVMMCRSHRCQVRDLHFVVAAAAAAAVGQVSPWLRAATCDAEIII